DRALPRLWRTETGRMIEIDTLSKAYNGSMVVDRVSFAVPPGTVAAVVGTSGSGKTTLLRMINRLVEPDSGMVRIDGEDTGAVRAHELRRRIGYVIQGYGLFPHRTVAENIATVPRLLGWEKARTARRADELMEVFQLDPGEYRNRFPRELSGGQQQRVGVAQIGRASCRERVWVAGGGVAVSEAGPVVR